MLFFCQGFFSTNSKTHASSTRWLLSANKSICLRLNKTAGLSTFKAEIKIAVNEAS